MFCLQFINIIKRVLIDVYNVTRAL